MSLLAAAVALSVAGSAQAQRVTINFSGDIEIPGDPVENALLGVNEEFTNDDGDVVPSSRYEGFVSFRQAEFDAALQDPLNIGGEGTSYFLGRDTAPTMDFGLTLGPNLSVSLADIPEGTNLDQEGAGEIIDPFPGDIMPQLLFFRSASDVDNNVAFEPDHLRAIGFSTALNDPIPVQVQGEVLAVEMTRHIPARAPGSDEFELTITESGGIREVDLSDLDRTDSNPNDGLRRDAANTIVTLLTFEIDSVDTAAVPVPAALPLMVSALGVMGVAARRRRKQA